MPSNMSPEEFEKVLSDLMDYRFELSYALHEMHDGTERDKALGIAREGVEQAHDAIITAFRAEQERADKLERQLRYCKNPHYVMCNSVQYTSGKCTCGLDALLKGEGK